MSSDAFIRHPEPGEIAGVRLGAIEGDPGVRPIGRQCVAVAAAWNRSPTTGWRATTSACPGSERRQRLRCAASSG